MLIFKDTSSGGDVGRVGDTTDRALAECECARAQKSITYSGRYAPVAGALT